MYCKEKGHTSIDKLACSEHNASIEATVRAPACLRAKGIYLFVSGPRGEVPVCEGSVHASQLRSPGTERTLDPAPCRGMQL